MNLPPKMRNPSKRLSRKYHSGAFCILLDSFRRCNRSGCEQASWLKSRTTSLNVSSPVIPMSESFISSFNKPNRNLWRDKSISQKNKEKITHPTMINLQCDNICVSFFYGNGQWLYSTFILYMLISAMLQ